MTLQLDLPADLAERLRREAERQGLPADAVTRKLLDDHLPPPTPSDTVAVIQSWIDEPGDDDDYDLLRSLDRARTSDRKLFPEELRGVSW